MLCLPIAAQAQRRRTRAVIKAAAQPFLLLPLFWFITTNKRGPPATHRQHTTNTHHTSSCTGIIMDLFQPSFSSKLLKKNGFLRDFGETVSLSPSLEWFAAAAAWRRPVNPN
jgi:hypothetical protein